MNLRKNFIISVLIQFTLPLQLGIFLLSKNKSLDILLIISFVLSCIYNYFLCIDIEKNNDYKNLERRTCYLQQFNENIKDENKEYENIIECYEQYLDNKLSLDVYKNSHDKFIDNQELTIKTGCPSLDSLLRFKYLIGKKYDMNINYHINLVGNSIIDAVDLCLIVGNLLDNAIYYNKEYGHKDIELYIDNRKKLKIVIENKAKNISKEILNNAFVKGFSTKGKEGDGMGLYIVKTIVENYFGNVYIEYSHNLIKFIIEI